MAIAGSGSFLKGLRGSATNLTMRNSLGETVVQGKRAKGQSNPSSAFIQSQAVAFQLNFIYHRIRELVQNGWTQLGGKKTKRGAWYSKAYGEAFDLSAAPVATFLPADLKVSNGIMTPTPFGGAVVADNSAATIAVLFSDIPQDATQLGTDTVFLAVHNRTQDNWYQMYGTSKDTSPGYTGTVPIGFMTTGDTIDVYMFFIGAPGAENAGTSSDSVYATATVVA